MKIGSHDTGFRDWADDVKTTSKLGSNLSAHEADALVKEHGGAELLIQKRDENNMPVYDVYALEVEEEGKSLHSVDIYSHMSFEDDIPQKLGGEAAKIAAPLEGSEDFNSYYRIETDKAHGIGNRLEQLGMSAQAMVLNTLGGVVNGGGGGVPVVGFLNGAYTDESFKYQAEDSAQLAEMKSDPSISPELYQRLQSTVLEKADRSLEYKADEDVFTQLSLMRRRENKSEIQSRLSDFVAQSQAPVSEQNSRMRDALMYMSAPHLIERSELPTQLGSSAEQLSAQAREQPLTFMNRILERE